MDGDPLEEISYALEQEPDVYLFTALKDGSVMNLQGVVPGKGDMRVFALAALIISVADEAGVDPDVVVEDVAEAVEMNEDSLRMSD